MRRLRRIRTLKRCSLRSSNGFTLPELLISITLLGIVGTVMASAMFVGARTGGASRDIVTANQDAEALSTIFVSDVENAATVTTTSPAVACGGAITSTKLVRLDWTDPQTAASYSSLYYFTPAAVGPPATAGVITRRLCQGSTLVTDHAVATNISGTPTVDCSPDCTTAPPSNVKITSASKVVSSDAAAFNYVVQASPRSAAANLISAATSRLVILSSGQLRTNGGDAQIQILSGTAYVGSTITQNSSNSVAIPGGLAYSGSCTSVQFSSSYTTPCTSSAAAPVDPYAGVDPTSLPIASCTQKKKKDPYICTPGYFSSTLAINDAYVFTPGFYYFGGGINATSAGWSVTTSGTGRVVLYSPTYMDFTGNSTANMTDTASAPLSLVTPDLRLGSQGAIQLH